MTHGRIWQIDMARSLAQHAVSGAGLVTDGDQVAHHVQADPEAALEAVLHWSGGQPFLTQKLLAMVCEAEERERPAAELVAAASASSVDPDQAAAAHVDQRNSVLSANKKHPADHVSAGCFSFWWHQSCM